MFVFSKGKPKTINLIKDRKNKWYGQKWGKTRTRRKKSGELIVQDWCKQEGGEYGVRFNVWKYNVGHGYSASDPYAHEHPAIFPEKLASDHIRSWSKEGDLVLDPFGGAFTTAKMARYLRRDFLSCELSEDYCRIGEKRLSQEVLI